jgi:Na+/proline symporter
MKRKPIHQKLAATLAMTMGVAYFGGGLFLAASSATYGILPSGFFRYFFAVLLILYGGYRFYRGYQQNKENN